MGWGKSFKKFAGKVVNTVTGGNATINKVVGLGLAPVTGGASLNVANQANRMEAAHEARKEAQQQAAAEAQAADKANKEFISSVNRQRAASLLDKTKTDYTGDLSEDYEDEEEITNKLLSRPLVIKRRKLLGM